MGFVSASFCHLLDAHGNLAVQRPLRSTAGLELLPVPGIACNALPPHAARLYNSRVAERSGGSFTAWVVVFPPRPPAIAV